MIKYSDFFARWEDDWKVMLKEMCDEATADKNSIVIPVLEGQGVCSIASKSIDA